MTLKFKRSFVVVASSVVLFGLGYVTAIYSDTTVSSSGINSTNKSDASPASLPSSSSDSSSASSPLETFTPAEYQELDPQTGEQVTKEGVLFQTFGTGATKWIDSSVLSRIGVRKDAARELLDHSRKLMEAYLVGTSEVQGAGDYIIIGEEPVADLLNKDYEQFQSLFDKELKTDSPDDTLASIVRIIDRSYEGAIDNLTWSPKEKNDAGIDEEKEYRNIRSKVDNTLFMKARDVFQRYYTWLFGGKIGSVDGLETEDRPVPDHLKSGIKTP